MTHTGLEFCFQPLYQQSVPGFRINEDGFGLSGHCAWVIDGATGVLDERLTPGPTDAAWLVQAMSRQLENSATSVQTTREAFSALEADLQAAFRDVTAHVPAVQDDHAPSACLGFIRLSGLPGNGRTFVEGAFLGDVVALVPSQDGIVRWTDERAKPFERRTLAALGAEGHEPGRIPQAVRRQILENRSKLNQPDGYWVVNPRRPWAGRELTFRAAVRPEEPIVLATAGFMRLVDVFGRYSDGTLHARLAAGEGESLMNELRDLERADPVARAHVRVKTHDDATVLVIAPEPYS
ncbi:hypothetical protein [Microvirga aerophila]|uniref:PPM-type phosphatase domain-containing protein n=1 Tax=Microvirga aerophila TaxID=670291 RepID=A0A512BLF5_9HYPH|nr:hypothetical protein [Microvirga aerophila]GEO12758.1 hypothetical protein MAE02_04540 [Microvirga aerophila]